MIIDYDHNPNITFDQKIQSLKESVQMALNDVETKESQASGKIDGINTSLAELLTKMMTTETLSFTSQYVTSIGCCRCGKVVTIALTNMISVPNGQSITLFTLPKGWRPLFTCTQLLRNPTDAATSMMRMSVSTTGAVTVYQYGSATSAASTNASCTLTFVTA